jgi:DNA-binding LacI/PurR family transcriptional regulator
MVCLFCTGFARGAWLEKHQSIQRLLDESGLDAPLYTNGESGGNSASSQIATFERLCRQHPGAVVCETLSIHDDVLHELQRYQERGGIVVCYDVPTILKCDTVIFDRVDNTYQTTQHLLQLGHRDIGLYVVGQVGWRARYVTPRVEGFERALHEHDLKPRSEWMFHGLSSEEDGARLAEQYLLLQQRPSAMCIVNESVASAFINELARAGVRVPHDVSVVSHDDLPIARYASVPLTTVTHPVRAIAQEVVEMVRSRLSGEYSGAPRSVTVRGEMVVRQSTAPLPHQA